MSEKSTEKEEERMRLINQKQRNTCRLNQRELVETMPNNEWVSVQALTEKLFVEEKRVKQLLIIMTKRKFWDVKKHPEKKDFFKLIQ